MMEMPRDVNGNIVAPKSQHRIIPVEELRSNYAILQSKRTACELQHWCISLVVVSIFFSALALILTGFMIVKPAIVTQNFLEADCEVITTKHLGRRECKCGGFTNDDPYCMSTYSCLQIRVAYTTKDSIFNDPWSRTIPLPDYSFENETEYGNIADTYEDGTKYGVLFENELQMLSTSNECSFSACRSDSRMNKIDVEHFRNKWGEPSKTYKCFYNPNNATQVISEKKFKKVHIFHALFWPSAILVISLVSYCLVRRCHNEDKKAKRVQNEMRGISSVRKPNFVIDAKERNYMRPIQTESGPIPFNFTSTPAGMSAYDGPCTRG